MVITILAWLGVGLLLVVAGLRRGNLVGRIGACGAIVIFFVVSEPFHRIGTRIANLFRRDEYAFVYPGAPECSVEVSIRSASEAAAFERVVRKFARQEHIRECRQKRYLAYSGPPRPTFKGVHVAIWSGVWWTTNASLKTASIRLAPFDEKYPAQDFKQLAESLATRMRAAFPGRTKVTYKDAERHALRQPGGWRGTRSQG